MKLSSKSDEPIRDLFSRTLDLEIKKEKEKGAVKCDVYKRNANRKEK